jgi:hypothetical protein
LVYSTGSRAAKRNIQQNLFFAFDLAPFDA